MRQCEVCEGKIEDEESAVYVLDRPICKTCADKIRALRTDGETDIQEIAGGLVFAAFQDSILPLAEGGEDAETK